MQTIKITILCEYLKSTASLNNNEIFIIESFFFCVNSIFGCGSCKPGSTSRLTHSPTSQANINNAYISCFLVGFHWSPFLSKSFARVLLLNVEEDEHLRLIFEWKKGGEIGFYVC